ncbi:MAG: folate-binding protein [Betaproteobacteria bacterium]|nr:MAG: folate-binding protein [Betaproteobacteria bacterium]
MDAPGSCCAAELTEYGAIAVSGGDARAFLHTQLTNDIEHLPPQAACLAGWCSAKGRLLATFLVASHGDGFVLQVAHELAPAILKRLQLFVLRSKVKLSDASAEWAQFGVWGDGADAALGRLGIAAPTQDLGIARAHDRFTIRLSARHYLLFASAALRAETQSRLPQGDASDWALEEIRAGRPHVVQATQDLFVPQMVNFELLGGVDFRKGCYPGQEVVARTQYRGQLKRRMVRLRAPQTLRAGQDLYSDDTAGQPSGTVVNAARGEALAVIPLATLEHGAAVRAQAGGEALEVLPLPYAA